MGPVIQRRAGIHRRTLHIAVGVLAVAALSLIAPATRQKG